MVVFSTDRQIYKMKIYLATLMAFMVSLMANRVTAADGKFEMAPSAENGAKDRENFLAIKFDAKSLKQCPDTGSGSCSLPYTLSILEPAGKFDLKSSSPPQEGTSASEPGQQQYSDETAIGLLQGPSASSDSKKYVGIKFAGVPENIQDYFIIDVSNSMRDESYMTDTTVTSNGVNFNLKAQLGYVDVNPATHGPGEHRCSCGHLECYCYEHIYISHFGHFLDATANVSIKVLKKEMGIKATLAVKGKTKHHNFQKEFSKEVSVANPPDICFPPDPELPVLEFCVRFHDLSFSKEKVDGCLSVGATFHFLSKFKNVGCFHIPI